MAEKLRVAAIGHTGRGDYGHSLDLVWLEIPSAEIVAVADPDPKGLAAAAERLKISNTFADYRQMLDEAKPQFVSVCPRFIDSHHAIGMACAERGIHMYMEKPFCGTLAQADELAAACERTHTRLAMACQTHYSPKLKVAKQLIDDGKLGTILEFRARGKEDHRGGAEDMWVLGTHMFDLIRYFGGAPTSCYATITKEGKPITKANLVPGNEGIGPIAGDNVLGQYSMPGGATAFFASRRGAGKGDARFGLQIFGTQGVLELMSNYLAPVKFLPDPTWSPARSKKAWLDVSSAGIDKPEPIAKGGNLEGNRVAVEDLIASVTEHREPLCGVNEARGTLEFIHAAFASQVAGTRVEMPLVDRSHPLDRLQGK